MTKTLKQILDEKPILFTADVPERVKEWLTQKRQNIINKFGLIGHDELQKMIIIDELLEELK